MSLRYCFESSRVPATLSASKRSDLAVVDTEGRESHVRTAVRRGVWVYGYLNVGALEKERSYYEKFHHIRLAKYSVWDGEYWINPTAKEWQDHPHDTCFRIHYTDNEPVWYGYMVKR
jgi:endo-alpha-1,4-polygalactosaminidase (GH114 family)